MPQPQPQPSPKPDQPKPDNPKPAEPAPEAPDKVDWKDTTDAGLDKNTLKKSKVFEQFTNMDDLEATKPVMIYFFWPAEDENNADKDVSNQVRRCKIMEENILSSEEVRLVSLEFHCLRCNVKEVSEDLKKKYKITIVPKIIFFDVKGRKAWQLSSTISKPESVAKKMEGIARKSKALLDKMKQ